MNWSVLTHFLLEYAKSPENWFHENYVVKMCPISVLELLDPTYRNCYNVAAVMASISCRIYVVCCCDTLDFQDVVWRRARPRNNVEFWALCGQIPWSKLFSRIWRVQSGHLVHILDTQYIPRTFCILCIEIVIIDRFISL